MALTNKTASILWVDHAAGAAVPPPETFLTSAEQAQADALRFARRREEWLVGRWAAARLMEGLPELRKAGLKNELSGAPYLERDGKRLAGCVTLSHRAGEGFCAYSRDLQIGADVELVEPRSAAFIQDYFTAEERRSGSEYLGEACAIWANLMWSAKEAVLKTLRTGLRMDTRQVVIHLTGELDADNRWQALEIKCAAASGYWLGWWQRRGSYVFTLAALSKELCNQVELHEIVDTKLPYETQGTSTTIFAASEI